MPTQDELERAQSSTSSLILQVVVVHRTALDSIDLILVPCRKTSWEATWRGGGGGGGWWVGGGGVEGGGGGRADQWYFTVVVNGSALPVRYAFLAL